MMTRSTLLHLRIPFSFFLMPVYWFALSISPEIDVGRAVISFIALHIFIYPASNGFNSYYDKDESSIGGLEKPPPVSTDLLITSLFFDGVGLIMAFFVGMHFTVALIIYGLISKAYSHPAIRLKKYPVISLLATSIFQGGFIFLAVYQAVNNCTIREMLRPEVLYPALLNTLMLVGSYPITQVYQHEEDTRRGDLTMSRLLGVKGTFLFSAVLFTLAAAGFIYYYTSYYTSDQYAVMFAVFLLPVLLFFLNWSGRVFSNATYANFKYTMRMNFISAICLNALFISIFVIREFIGF